MSILNCQHSVVELKAADSRAVRSGAMAWKSSAREIVYELFKSAVPFTRASKIASDDRKSRNKVLPELFFEGKAVLSQNQTQIFHKMTE